MFVPRDKSQMDGRRGRQLMRQNCRSTYCTLQIHHTETDKENNGLSIPDGCSRHMHDCRPAPMHQDLPEYHKYKQKIQKVVSLVSAIMQRKPTNWFDGNHA